MNYRGRIKGNIVVIDGDARIPEGAEVVVTLVAKNRLADFAGVLPTEEVDEMRRLLVEIRQTPIDTRVYQPAAEMARMTAWPRLVIFQPLSPIKDLIGRNNNL